MDNTYGTQSDLGNEVTNIYIAYIPNGFVCLKNRFHN